MGVVKDFMNSRAARPTPGKWCAGFSACKNYAIQNNIPLITAWISDDGCRYCCSFAKASTSKKFTNWMKTTGYIFWLGCKYCKGEDGEYGAGYKWCYGIAGSGGHYPGCRIYWESNGKVNVNKYRNGDVLAKKEDDQQAWTNINTFSNLLKDFQPTPPESPKYSITFNPNGGTLTSGMTRTVTENTTIGELPPTSGQPLKTMFGLCRDCTIITKDNKILQYSAAAQKIKLVGDYNPNEFLAVSTKIT